MLLLLRSAGALGKPGCPANSLLYSGRRYARALEGGNSNSAMPEVRGGWLGYPPRRQRRPAARTAVHFPWNWIIRITIGTLVAVFFGGSLTFVSAFLRQSSVIASEWTNVMRSPASSGLNATGPGTNGDTGPVWGGEERVNILLMGMDCREEEGENQCRTDSMLVATLDPKTHSAGLLSIPRDLWVTIPNPAGWTEDRVNTAWQRGAAIKYPGGPAAFAKRTVSYNLGIPIHFAVWIGMDGFVQVIDTLGGLTIDVPKPVKDNDYPTPTYGIERIYFEPGLQWMNGDQALKYARTRHQDSDVGRAQRQQQVLTAARQKALQLDLLPKLPVLIGQFHDIVKTDMQPPQILALARIAKDVDTSHLVTKVVPTYSVTRSSGAEVLNVDSAGLKRTLNELMTDPASLPDNRGAVVEVLNATTIPLLATNITTVLEANGIPVARADSAFQNSQAETVIYAVSGARITAGKIAAALGLPSSRIRDFPASINSTADIQVLLGRDAKNALGE